MKFLRKRSLVLTNVFSALALAFVSFPVIAEDDDHSMKDVDQAVETWGLRLQEKVAFQLQQEMTTNIELQYEKQLAQQTSDDAMEQVALAASIEQDPVISTDSAKMVANVVPAGNEGDCDN